MNARTRRSGALLAGAAMIGGLLLAPTAAQAQPVRAESATAGACQVSGGSFTWGVKESFRAYISGSIANGSWEESDGATYETPNFSWGGATGSIDPETGEGSVSFTGTVHFTGHDGVLDLTLANPTIEFEGDGSAALLLDARSNDMEGEVAIDATQEWVGDVTVPDQLGVSDNALQLQDLPTKLTNSGAKAFAGFYEADIDLDPIAVDLQFASCADSAGGSASAAGDGSAANSDDAALEAPVATQTPNPVEASNDIPWLPIIIGGIAILVIGITGGILLGGRKPKSAATAAAPQTDAAPQQPNPQATDKLFGDQQ